MALPLRPLMLQLRALRRQLATVLSRLLLRVVTSPSMLLSPTTRQLQRQLRMKQLRRKLLRLSLPRLNLLRRKLLKKSLLSKMLQLMTMSPRKSDD